MLKNRFLCYQLTVVSEEFDESATDIQMDVIIRNIGAKNKEEAIGKFIKHTQHIKAIKKLNPVCFLLGNLIKIN